MRCNRVIGVVAVLPLLLTPALGRAGQDSILVGLDQKAFFEEKGQVFEVRGEDAVLVLDASDPAHPRIAASLPLTNSVAGPPTNLQVTPDGKLGLVANSLVVNRTATGWAPAPDDKLFVIDLEANPPRLLDTVQVGRQPSGLAISHAGNLALIANRAGKSVSVLQIEGKQVRHVGEVGVEDEVAAIAITPDGRRAFVVKNTVHKVGVLQIDGTRVTYDKARDIPVGWGAYNIDVTPDGSRAITANTGVGGDGHVDTVTVIDAQADPPRAIDHVVVGDGPEGFAISPDGRTAIAVLLKGSAAPHAAWSYTRDGAVVLLRIEGGKVSLVPGEVAAGALPEGIAYSRNGEYAYVGDYVDKVLRVYRIADGKITDTGTRLQLPGQPASVRGVAR